jgi:hypothetical protein
MSPHVVDKIYLDLICKTEVYSSEDVHWVVLSKVKVNNEFDDAITTLVHELHEFD